MSVALLTMGSGGVRQSDSNGTSAAADVDSASSADQTLASGSSTTDEETSTVRSASANGTGPRPVVSPANAAEAPDDGSALEIALSDDYIQGRYYTGGGLLGFDETKGHVGVYYSDDRDLILNIGLMSDPTPVFMDGLTLSAGGRGYLALFSSPSDDVFALAPGVEVRYALPPAHPMYVVGSLFYAPDILTLGDAKDVVDLDLRYEAQLIPNAVGFIGYREFRFNSDEGADQKAASEIQIGGRFAF
jgi:hypothetical protein